jgi:hypothetical protein
MEMLTGDCKDAGLDSPWEAAHDPMGAEREGVEVLATRTSRAADAGTAPVEQRAYELYLARGNQPGSDVDDWFEAERQLRQEGVLAGPSVNGRRKRAVKAPQ